MKKIVEIIGFSRCRRGFGIGFAGTQWIGNSYIQANGTWYQAHGTESWAAGGAFDGHDFGAVTNIALGGQLQIGDNGNNWNGGAGERMTRRALLARRRRRT